MCIVTVSRGSFSAARAVAEDVARRLAVPCVSREILVEAAQAAGIAEGRLTEVLERPPSFFERASLQRREYLAFVRASLYEHAAKGGFVYHGHDGHLLLGELPNVLRIRVVAPLEHRVRFLEAAQGMDERAARRHIARIDGHRARWSRFLYGVEWDDPLLYDLVVNLENIGASDAAAAVADLASGPRYEWTDDLRKKARDLALASRVLATLQQTDEGRGAELRVEADGGVVVLRGHVGYDETRKVLVRAAEQIAGVETVRSEIALPSDAWR